MKRNYLTFAALASIVLASCTNDELAGDSLEVSNPEAPQAIAFSSGFKNISRADLYGSDAAAKLGNTFVVYGTKHISQEDKTADNDKVVFNNFQVVYTPNTAGTAASNSSDWDYLSLQAYDATPTSQGIKYWDYNAAKGHTFYAFSSSDISFPKNTTDNKVQVTKVTEDGTSLYNKGYAVTLKTGANLNNLYFSDRVEVAKDDYDKTVNFTFRNIGAKLRIGFYETIPGYSVKIDRFYIDADATAAITDFAEMNTAKTDGFYASLQNIKRGVEQTLNVTYYSSGTEINRPKFGNPSADYVYTLNLGNAAGIIGQELATSSSSPTWVDGTSGDYTPIYPFETNTNPLLLKLDFTMTAEDGSPDVIHVKGARAIVPAQYVQWKSNFAYTYIFKISDKTNGTTGKVDANGDPTDPEGLKPITFDAITVDVTEERQETISSISTNSITTYAEGAIVDEYKTGKSIYVVTTDNSNNVITPSAIGIGAGQARVYKIDKATTEASVLAKLTGSPIDITLTPLTPPATIETTIPLADGTTPAISNVKFTPSASGYYAYVYTTTAYVAPTYAVQTSGAYVSSNTYYMLSGSGAYYAVSVPTEAAFEANKAKLYLQTAAGTPGVYDVKVITVQ